jgi:hypothetical protein
LIGESGLSPEDIEYETEKLGHKVSRYTIMGWLYKSVRRPQNYTMTIVALALGYSKTWAPLTRGKPAAAERARIPAGIKGAKPREAAHAH